jgi:hypothetical protein
MVTMLALLTERVKVSADHYIAISCTNSVDHAIAHHRRKLSGLQDQSGPGGHLE